MEVQDKNVKDFIAGMEALTRACDTLSKALMREINPETVPKEKPVTLEEVRGKLAELSRNGKTAEVHELIKSHGGSKLSDIEPGKYPALLSDAEELAHAK